MAPVKPLVIAITGGTRGLGAGLAEAWEAAGHRVALCGRSVREPGATATRLLRRCDVTRPEEVQTFLEAAVAAFGGVDLWVNNAGVLPPVGPLRGVPLEAAARNVEVNLLGVVHGTRAYVAWLHEAGRNGLLVNISSGAARHAIEGWGLYCATKAAVDRLTEVVALEERGRLRAWSVAPGVIDTDMQATIRATPRERFPLLDDFIAMKEQEAFSSTDFVARELLALATERQPAEVCQRLPSEA